MELLQRTVSLPGCTKHWNFCNKLPDCLGAVGDGTPAMHYLTARGPWGLELLQCTASSPRARGSASIAVHCLTAWGQGAVELLQYTATPPGGCGQCNCCYALPHCLGVVGSGTFAVHCLTALGQWVVQLMQPLPHCLGEVGSATLAIHCLTARGAWVAELLLKMASLPPSPNRPGSGNGQERLSRIVSLSLPMPSPIYARLSMHLPPTTAPANPPPPPPVPSRTPCPARAAVVREVAVPTCGPAGSHQGPGEELASMGPPKLIAPHVDWPSESKPPKVGRVPAGVGSGESTATRRARGMASECRPSPLCS